MRRLILLLLLPSLCLADPGPATRWLMNEPASLFDLGMYKLDNAIRERAQQIRADVARNEEINVVSGAAGYDYEDDEIIVLYGIYGSQSPREHCAAFFDGTNKAFLQARARVLFKHDGYESTDQPNEFYEAIAGRMVVRCEAGNTVGEYRMADDRVFWSTDDND